MTVPESAPDPAQPDRTAPPDRPGSPGRSDASPWNWLLLPAVVVPLLTFLYNSDEPRLFGFPMFYWLQFVMIALGVTCTTVVFQMTKRRG